MAQPIETKRVHHENAGQARHDHEGHDHGPGGHAHAADACCADHEQPAESTPRQPIGDGRIAFKIQGMDCAEEVDVLRREVGPLVGGEDRLAFDVLNGKMAVSELPAGVSAETIRQAVARTGMRAETWDRGRQRSTDADNRQRRIQAAFTVASGGAILAGIAVHAWMSGSILAAFGIGTGAALGVPTAAIAAYLLAVALGSRFVVIKAWFAARRMRPDMNLLMVVAVLGAIAIGEYLEAATVSFLFALSLALESWSVGRARRAIAALLDLAPPTVNLIDGGERQVAAAEVPVGARFAVKPGERIPLDGRVIEGTSHVNQAPITGESLPVTKEPGAEVFAGTINGDGALTLESTKRAEDTTLAHIIRLVEEAQSQRAESQQWVDRFARVYTPAVMVLAIVVAIAPPLLFGVLWSDWIYRALVLLVIACPCALVISTPVSIVAALAASARAGVLVKGGIHLETPARLRAIAFDKTGTLTEGRPRVAVIEALNSHTVEELLERAAALEARSSHPLARAILEHAQSRGVVPIAAADVQIIPGKGVTGRFDGRSFWLGSHRFLEERGGESAEVHERVEGLEAQGKTVIVVGNDDHVCGIIALADSVRPDAAAMLQELRGMGIEHLVMLTGDNRTTAETIAEATGIDEVHAELLPADKVAAIESLVGTYGQVAMIGDGVNDAPAMSRATLGIAMGAIGSDAAIEAADIALMSDDLAKLPWLIRHSRRTLAIIRQNIAFSLAVKMAFALLTFVGLASLWGAIAADVGASLLVVANGLRLLRTSEVSVSTALTVTPRPPAAEAIPGR